jgi:hypothetical protein
LYEDVDRYGTSQRHQSIDTWILTHTSFSCQLSFSAVMGQWQKIFTKAAKLCSAIHNDPYLVDVNLEGGCSNGLGEVMLHSLLSADELKLERL